MRMPCNSAKSIIWKRDAILLATGRRPNTSGLNLEVAGVKVNERGAIIVDEWLRTTNPAIRAIGDVKADYNSPIFHWTITALSVRIYLVQENGVQVTVSL